MVSTKEPSTRAEGLITAQLGVELKTEWVKWCQARELVPGKALRKLVEKALAEGLELTTSVNGSKVRVIVGSKPDTGLKVRREFGFTPSEDKAIEAVALAQGFGYQEWVIAATRAALANSPSYGQAEIEAVTKSNASLVQILNELAALKRGEDDPDWVKRFEVLESLIRQHVEQVSIAMAKGAQRWLLKS
jgi:hypothetical protein